MRFGRRGAIHLAAGLALATFLPGRLRADDPPAEPAAEQELTVITSDKLTFDQVEGFALFEQNVVVKDSRMTLTADRLRVNFDKAGKAETIEATGNVHITQPNRESRSGEAHYEVKTGKIILTVEPKISQGPNFITAERITIWRNQSRMIAFPRPILRMVPDDSTRDLF